METKLCKCCGRQLPIESFSVNAWGTTSVCKECNKKNRSEARLKKSKEKAEKDSISHARLMRISEFTPRELMEELARKGYKGKLSYVRVEEIDICNF